MVTSQVSHLPHYQGIIVAPSGRLPFSLVRPSGSFLEGMLALPSALHMISLIILCSCCLPALFLQARPWRPLAVTLSPQLHIVSCQVAYQRRSVSPHRTGGDPML